MTLQQPLCCPMPKCVSPSPRQKEIKASQNGCRLCLSRGLLDYKVLDWLRLPHGIKSFIEADSMYTSTRASTKDREEVAGHAGQRFLQHSFQSTSAKLDYFLFLLKSGCASNKATEQRRSRSNWPCQESFSATGSRFLRFLGCVSARNTWRCAVSISMEHSSWKLRTGRCVTRWHEDLDRFGDHSNSNCYMLLPAWSGKRNLHSVLSLSMQRTKPCCVNNWVCLSLSSTLLKGKVGLQEGLILKRWFSKTCPLTYQQLGGISEYASVVERKAWLNGEKSKKGVAMTRSSWTKIRRLFAVPSKIVLLNSAFWIYLVL